MAVGDFNGDGINHLAVTDLPVSSGSPVSVLLGSGGGYAAGVAILLTGKR